MLGFIDCHTHLTDGLLSSNIDKIRENYLKNGVDLVVDTGCSVNSSFLAQENSKKFSEIYYSAGIHPESANFYSVEDVLKIESLLNDKKCLAVGEIGFDYHYDGYDKKLQKELFLAQLELANSYNLPIVVHSRDACQDTLNTLKENLDKLKNGFLMHCFSESKETAKEIIKMGGYFSFGGAITFKNSKKGEVLREIPIDRILVETDAPYLTPTPFRGQINEPKNVVYTYQKIAEIYNISVDELKIKVANNFSKLFKIDL